MGWVCADATEIASGPTLAATRGARESPCSGTLLGAFLAPPFTGLGTLPALGVVLVSLGVLLEDFAVVALALIAGGAGVLLEIVLGKAAGPGHREHLLDRSRCAYSSSAGERLGSRSFLLSALAAFALCAAEELGELSLRTTSGRDDGHQARRLLVVHGSTLAAGWRPYPSP
jgi:hypothetical protein